MEFVPRKLYYKIREVCEIVELEAHVLRFWESEFPDLTPPKGRNGQRTYRPDDIKLILEIRKLLYEDGYTIAGARKRMGMQSRTPAVKKQARKKDSRVPKRSAKEKATPPPKPDSLPLFDFTPEEINDTEINDQVELSKEFREIYAGARQELAELELPRPPDSPGDLMEAYVAARQELMELRDLPQSPIIPKHSGESLLQEKVKTPSSTVTNVSRPTSDRLKRVQTELENILTLLDRE